MQALSVLPLSPSADSHNEQEEEEFSFVCTNPQAPLISADELFHDGKIRAMVPVFNQALPFTNEYDGTASPLRLPLRKLFVEQRHPLSDEQDRAPVEKTAVEASNKRLCEWKKSNSTGLSKLWRFRGLKLRSNSDGRDTFVFLNPPVENAIVNKVQDSSKGKTTSSAHERHYLTNRTRKESEKQKSYLPYRQNVVGFFTNVNGFSKNFHPF